MPQICPYKGCGRFIKCFEVAVREGARVPGATAPIGTLWLKVRSHKCGKVNLEVDYWMPICDDCARKAGLVW